MMDNDDNAAGNEPYLQIAQQNVFHIQELLQKLERAEEQRDAAIQSLQESKNQCESLRHSAQQWEQSSKQWELQYKHCETKFEAMRVKIISAVQSRTLPADANTTTKLSAHTKRFGAGAGAAAAATIQRRQKTPLNITISKSVAKQLSSDIFAD